LKFSNKKLLIFDFDGTLIDSVPDLVTAVNSMLLAIGYEQKSEASIRSWVGNGAETLVKRALLNRVDVENLTVEKELFEKALNLFLSSYKENACKSTKLYDNVAQTLQTLKANDYIMTIVTNKPYAFVQPILKGLNIENFFEIYLGGDSLDEKKPSPKPLLYLCDELKIEKEKSLMIGDSKNDIIAANSAGIESIGVTYGYNYDESISVYNPTVIIDDFSQILEYLEIKE